MTTTKWIRLIYGIILSLALVFAGICLIAACICIYQSGDRAFSREAVALYFSDIAAPVYLALALTVGGFILSFALPKDKPRKKADKDYSAILRHLLEKRDISLCDPKLQKEIRSQRIRRKVHTYINIALLAIGSLAFLLYATDPKNFPSEDITGSMACGTIWMLICLFVPFVYAICNAYGSRRSMQKEIALLRSFQPNCQKSSVVKEKNLGHVLRIVLLFVSILLITYGYFSGGTADVLTKAVNICTECVGLG